MVMVLIEIGIGGLARQDKFTHYTIPRNLSFDTWAPSESEAEKPKGGNLVWLTNNHLKLAGNDEEFDSSQNKVE